MPNVPAPAKQDITHGLDRARNYEEQPVLATRFQGTVLSKVKPTKQGHHASSPVREHEPSTTFKSAPPEGLQQDRVPEDCPSNQSKYFTSGCRRIMAVGSISNRANQTATEMQSKKISNDQELIQSDLISFLPDMGIEMLP